MLDNKMIGQVLAQRYEVQRQLGKQYGRQTLLARDLQTRELVVVKLLFLGNDFEWQDIKLFEREAETLKALSHPAIPRYLDYFEIDEPDTKGFASIQSYVEGKTLEEHLAAGRTFSELEVKELAKSLLEIITYLHELQPPAIHRDIKPSNILLHNRSAHSVGEVYLVDFGSVQTLAAKEGSTITVVGTYGYMPPEQFGGRAVPASDLYSLGATLIYLITGRHPTELPQKDFRIQFQQLANLNPDFADWLEWMTEPSLDKRLTSAREALEALEKPRMRNETALAVRQPLGSEVVLKKTAEFIEIILPAKGIGFGAIALLSCGLPFSMLFLHGIIGIYAANFRQLIWLCSLLFLFITVFIYPLFRRSRLRIDRHKISFVGEIFGLKWNHFHPARREDISELILLHSWRTVSAKNEPIRKQIRLIIRAGERDFELDKDRALKEAELNWLASELSDWLGLPITQTIMKKEDNI